MSLPEDKVPARAMILDRELVRRVYALRTNAGNPPHDAVWDGLLVLNPLPDNEHVSVKADLLFTLGRVTLGRVFPGCNVSDREADWLTNFRCPDVAVYLPTTFAVDCGTHWCGGPDLAVELTSPGEDPRLKLDFYAKVNTRELLIVNRYPWEVELYQLRGGKLVLIGVSNEASNTVLMSSVLPLSFQVKPGTPRPAIHISHQLSTQTWTA